MGDAESDIIARAYAAALDDTLWQAWSVTTCAAMGGVGATFFVMDARNRSVERFVLHGRPESLVDEYFGGWGQLDPQVPQVAGLTQSTVYTSDDHIDPANAEAASYVEWQKRVGGVDHHLAFAALLDDRGFRSGLSIHRAIGAGPAPLRDRRRLWMMLPDLQRAMQLGFRHNEMLRDAYWNGVTAVEDGNAALLIDEQGRVSRVTDAALHLIARQDALAIRARRLCCADPAADGELAAIVHRAIAAQAPRSGAVRVANRFGRALILIVYPLARARRMLAPCDAAALVRIVDPLARPRDAADLYRSAFGFTRREAELAMLVLGGHSPESAAATLRIGMPTARQYLRALFAKTGTSRQAELVRLLGRIH